MPRWNFRSRDSLLSSLLPVYNSVASRIYAWLDKLSGSPATDRDQVREIVRLAFGFSAEKTSRYLEGIEDRVKQSDGITER